MELQRVESDRAGDFYYQGQHPSGLRVYLYPKENSSSTRAVLGARYGSVDNSFQLEDQPEPERMPEGVAHYLEHKLFESQEGDAFARYAETGANANAYTGFESTCYVFTCTDQLYQSLEILLDFVQSPYFTEETVAKEQGIISQEIRMYDDMASWRVMFDYLKAMYHVHPVRNDAAGTLESISRITPEHLYRCYHSFYQLSNMVLVLAGRFDVDKVLALCDRMLKLSAPVQVRRLLPSEPPGVVRSFTESRLPIAMPVFQFGYKDDGGKPRSEQDLAAMGVLLSVMASDASPMFRRLLDEELVNESSFSYQYFEGRGFATVTFGGESRDPEAVAAIIREEAARLQREGTPERAFQWAKRSLYGESIASLNSAVGIANWLADFALQGLEPFAYIDALAGLTLEQTAEKLAVFQDDKTVLSVVRPL